MDSYTKATEKRKARDSGKQIHDKKLKKSPVYEDKFLLLRDAFQECDGISDNEINVVLLLPENVVEDIDNECGNDTELTDISLELAKDVSGTIEINTTQSDQNKKKKS